MRIQLRTLTAAVLMLALMAPAAQSQITIGPTDYGMDFVDAVESAVAGDVVNVPDGTYIITTTANLSAPNVTIQGQSEAGTIIQVNVPGSGWGLAFNADGTTIQDMTFESVSNDTQTGFILKGNPNSGSVVNGLTIQRVTVFGDATAGPTGRPAGIDVNGFDNVQISDVESRDASSGNGIQLSGCHNVTIDNATTSNNAWGSIGVFATDDLNTNRGSDNVTIDGATFSGADTPSNGPVIYIEDEFGVVNTNITVTGWDYHVRNSQFRTASGFTDSEEFTFVLETESDAIDFALGWPGYEEFSTVQRISDGNFVVGAGTPANMSIQTAVDAASAGGTVEVTAGSFTEQVEIAKDLTLQGDGMMSTTIVSPEDLTDFYNTGTNTKNYPVVYVHDADDVTVRDLTVDGNNQGNNNNRFYGIAYRNAGGTITQVKTMRTRHTPDPNDGSISGVQGGNGIYVYNNDAVTRSMAITNNQVELFQKNGITVNSLDGTATTVTIDGNTVAGSGVMSSDLGEPAQNGIQIYGSLITGAVDGNAISGIAYDNTNASTKWVATTILDFFSGVDVTNNVIPNSQVAVYKFDGYGQILNNDITVNKVGVASWGIIATDPPRAVPQPDIETGAKSSSMAKSTTLNVLVDNNTVVFSGTDNTATFGIEADAGFGPNDLDVTITNNTVTGFEAGVDIYQCQSGCDTGVFTNVAVNQNDLTGNDFGVRSNVGYLTVDASCNWYGDTSGPFETTLNPGGTGSAVQGDVTFEPWLDGPSGACNLSTNFASAGPAPGELNDCDDCLDIPVSLTRLDTSAARGVSVTFELSSNLELCGTPVVSSGTGAFYDGYVSDVQEFFLDNGDGTYTFDTAILGEPCGPTVGGEVFTIPVTFASGLTGDQQGTLDIVGVTFRDCDNAPLPLLPGPGATIDIDVTTPGAITDLAAVQQKTGNTPPNTTAINLSWTLPGDPDLTAVRIFRKGFGNYPEYDDLGGAAPAAPDSIGAALANGWTEVSGSPLAPTATSYSDEPGTRDFWYYVAFAEDECYESAVSGRTDGTLSYHLGDVAPGTGNNIVFTGDISDLGDAYGTFDGDANYDAEADVGPTTDFSVDARPTTDDQIQFEDLILFAINFNQVSKLAPAQLAAANALELVEPTELTAGDEIRVPLRLSGDGSVQGLTVELGWNSDVLEYVGWAPGDIASAQNRAMPVFSPAAGVIDAAMMGVADTGIAGEGTLAHLRFRVKAEGPTDLRFDSVDARSATNEEVSLSGTLVQEASGTPAMLSRSVLRSNVPNPFNPSTKVRFALADRGHVSVQIFDLKGRLVRTLVDAPLTAGEHEIQWNGTDDGGRTVASGTYLLRMSAPDVTESRRLMLLK